MSDDVNHDHTERDELDAGIEALLGELDVDDLEPIRPPDDLWAGIERRVAVADETSSPSTAVRSIGDRRRRRTTWVLAAAAGLIVVLGVVAVVRRGTSEDVVSVASLAFDPTTFDPRGADATGEAHLLDSHGSYSIRLTDTKLPKVQGDDLELWLIEPGADGKPVDIAPVSLVDPDGDGTYEVPAGIDPDTHYLVDISIEPRDGDAKHSGHSILRGALKPA